MTRSRRPRAAPWPLLLAVTALFTATCTTAPTATTLPASDTTSAPVTAAPAVTTSPPTTTADPDPLPNLKTYGGEAILGLTLEPTTLNVFLPGGLNPAVALMGNAVWAGVYDVDGGTLELVPDVVTELPTVRNGGITINTDGSETIRYTIRDEAVWADGTPISGFDFEFTYQTIMDPDLPILRTIYEDIVPDSVVADDKEFRFTLPEPTLGAELIFDTILPAHEVAGFDFADDFNEVTWLSGGPFQFEQWRPGEFISLTRNPNYWKTDDVTGQDLPYLDRVILRFHPDTPSLLDAFTARDVDIINPPAVVDTLQHLDGLAGEGASLDVRPGPVWEHLGFQFGSNRLVTNPNSYNAFLEYRRAVAHALDKDKIVAEILQGYGTPMSSYVDAYSSGLSQGAWDQYPYDTEEARRYIAELCTRPDTDCTARPVTAVFSTSESAAQRVALSPLLEEMLTDVGIGYEERLEPAIVFLGETIDFGLFDLGEWAWKNRGETAALSNLVAIHDIWNPDAPPGPGPGLNAYRWGTAAVTGVVPPGFNQPASAVIDDATARYVEVRNAMQETVDARKLLGLVAEAENILADNLVFIPLYQHPDVGAVWADEIGGYEHAPFLGGDTWNVAEWYRADLSG